MDQAEALNHVGAGLTEETLAAAAGDRDAYSRIVSDYRTVVCSIALSITRDLEASEEVAQDVFLAAWRDLARLRNPASLLPWLRQMARNRARDQLRKGTVRRRLLLSQDDADRAMQQAVAPNSDIRENILDAEERRLLAEAIDALPEESREVITLFYREGQSVEQVARLLGIRADTIKKRLSRARAVLREAMLTRFGDALVRTVPGLVFSDRVMEATSRVLPVPSTATGTKIAAKSAAASTSAKALSVLGAVLGPAVGLVAQIVWTRREMARALDDVERTQLRTFGIVQALVVNAFVAALLLLIMNDAGSGPCILAAGAWVVSIIWMKEWWYERIVSRRRAAERQHDPTAAARQRRMKIMRWAGYATVVVGTLTLVVLRR